MRIQLTYLKLLHAQLLTFAGWVYSEMLEFLSDLIILGFLKNDIFVMYKHFQNMWIFLFYDFCGSLSHGISRLLVWQILNNSVLCYDHLDYNRGVGNLCCGIRIKVILYIGCNGQQFVMRPPPSCLSTWAGWYSFLNIRCLCNQSAKYHCIISWHQAVCL